MRMNWKTIIQDLIESGMTQYEIARELDLTQPMISDIVTGKRTSDIRWAHGQRLIELHTERCKAEAA